MTDPVINFVVLAGGKGSRLKRSTTKVLAKLVGKKVIDFPLKAIGEFQQKTGAKASVNVFGENYNSDGRFVPYGSVAAGARYVLGRYVPFLVGGYQYAKADDIGFKISDSGDTNSVDFSGSYITAGLGMFF